MGEIKIGVIGNELKVGFRHEAKPQYHINVYDNEKEFLDILMLIDNYKAKGKAYALALEMRD